MRTPLLLLLLLAGCASRTVHTPGNPLMLKFVPLEEIVKGPEFQGKHAR